MYYHMFVALIICLYCQLSWAKSPFYQFTIFASQIQRNKQIFEQSMFFQPSYNPRTLFSKVYGSLQKWWLLCKLPKHEIQCLFGLNLISVFLKHWKKHGKNKAPQVEKGTGKIKTFGHLIQYLYWINNTLQVATSGYHAVRTLSVVSDETIYCQLPLCSWFFLFKQNCTSNRTPSFSKRILWNVRAWENWKEDLGWKILQFSFKNCIRVKVLQLCTGFNVTVLIWDNSLKVGLKSEPWFSQRKDKICHTN